MKVLVFGETGQVARELQRAGMSEGHVLQSLSRAEANLERPQECASAITQTNADVVINAAAYTAVDRAESEPEIAQIVNVHSPAEMAKAARAKGKPFVHLSTDYVFDGTGQSAWRPNDKTNPLGVYGRTKRAGEEAVIAADGPSAILRTSWVFSAHGRNFVKSMLGAAKAGNKLRVVADQIGGPTPAASIAKASLSLAQNLLIGPLPQKIYHLSGQPAVNWADFAREIMRQSGRDIEVEDITTSDYPTPVDRPANSRLDCTSLARDIGFVQPDWRDALKAVLREIED